MSHPEDELTQHRADWSDQPAALAGDDPSCSCGFNGTPQECLASRQLERREWAEAGQ